MHRSRAKGTSLDYEKVEAPSKDASKFESLARTTLASFVERVFGRQLAR